MIDCKTEEAPYNGVEQLIASRCSNDGGVVSCINSCPGEESSQEECRCGTILYKNGRPLFGDQLNDYGILCFSANGTPLTELTALVRFLQTSLNFFDTTDQATGDNLRPEQQTFLPGTLDPQLEIQIPVLQENAGKSNYLNA